MGATARTLRAFTLETTVTDDGVLWRAEINDGGRLIDATRWTSGPRKAHRDGTALAHGHYWSRDDQPEYLPAA